jgi:hypothetical protein
MKRALFLPSCGSPSMRPLRHHHPICASWSGMSTALRAAVVSAVLRQFCPIRSGPFDRGETAGAAIASRFELQVLLRQTKSVMRANRGPNRGASGRRRIDVQLATTLIRLPRRPGRVGASNRPRATYSKPKSSLRSIHAPRAQRSRQTPRRGRPEAGD